MRWPVAVTLLAVAAPGCGSDGGSSPSPADKQSDKRGATLACLRDERHLDARPLGRDSIQVGDPRTGARVKFFLTNGEAEAAQFEGRGEGSEQIGSALLFVRRGSEDVLEDVEGCLDQL
jgi:hypothetical protein